MKEIHAQIDELAQTVERRIRHERAEELRSAAREVKEHVGDPSWDPVLFLQERAERVEYGA